MIDVFKFMHEYLCCTVCAPHQQRSDIWPNSFDKIFRASDCFSLINAIFSWARKFPFSFPEMCAFKSVDEEILEFHFLSMACSRYTNLCFSFREVIIITKKRMCSKLMDSGQCKKPSTISGHSKISIPKLNSLKCSFNFFLLLEFFMRGYLIFNGQHRTILR